MNPAKKSGIKALLSSILLILPIFLAINKPLFSDKSEKFAPKTLLTDEEHEWLANHPIIRLAPDPEFRPIEYFDNRDNYSGMAADYAILISQKLGFTFTIIQCENWDEVIRKAENHEVDVLNAVIKTPGRENYLEFTYPYLQIPSVIVVRKNEEGDFTLDKLQKRRVVMVSGYGYVDLILDKNPELIIDLAEDVNKALRMVAIGKADAFIGDLVTASYYIESGNLTNLRVSAETDPLNISGFAVRSDWPLLVSILNKGIALLSEEEKRAIHHKWVPLVSSHHISVTQIRNTALISAAVLIIIFLIVFFWTRTLKKMVRLKTEELQTELTEREKIEKMLADNKTQLQTIIRTIPDPVWLKDPDGRYLICNQVLENIFGATTSEIIGKTDYEFMKKKEADILCENDLATMKTKRAQKFEETVTIPNSGQRIFMETFKRSLYNSAKELVGVLGVGRDITNRKLAEKEVQLKNIELTEINMDLEKSRGELKKIIREKETLIRELYHRTKNTLQMINSMMILQANEYPKSNDIQTVVKNTETRIQSISLVHQMLYQSSDLSRISINEYINNLALKVLNSFGLTTEEIACDIDIGDYSFLLDSAIPFGLIINELLTNSCKYAFPDSQKGKITMSLKQTESLDYHFYYHDNGVGVSNNFDFRKNSTMGLQLIYNIGEKQLRGTIEMKNNDGVECYFKFHSISEDARI
ncbi:MAG: transporter substrate-binding domain-containing protein [Spirochaetes bacterium]|nr:transporter substrate-binding domain-containing protein [Spirochaetota bacterium]